MISCLPEIIGPNCLDLDSRVSDLGSNRLAR
jgi:hypothetical protein